VELGCGIGMEVPKVILDLGTIPEKTFVPSTRAQSLGTHVMVVKKFIF